MTKQDIVQDVAQSTGFVRSDVRNVLESFLGLVSESLQEGRSIEIRGFGTFSVKQRKSRPARNPRTGETVVLQERAVPLFKFSSDLKEQINEPGYLPVLPEAVPHVSTGSEA